MKILYITNKPVYPVVDGGTRAMEIFLESLISCNSEIHMINLATHKHGFSEESIPAAIKTKLKVQSFFIDTRLRAGKAFLNLFSRKSYNLSRFYDKKASLELQKLVKEIKPDCILFESLYSAVYLDDLKAHFAGKTILRSHNVEHVIWQRLAANSSGLKKLYLTKLYKNLKTAEVKLFQQFDKIFAISDDDAKEIKKYVSKEKVVEIPIGLKEKEIHADYSVAEIMHLGSMNWQPNKDSVDFILDKVLPALSNPIIFNLAGSYMPADKKYHSDSIRNHGKIEDTDEFLSKSGVLLSPVLSGSGVRIKILEAMNIGVPVITTKLGAEGLNIVAGRELIIAETAEEFSEELDNLLNNAGKRSEIGQNGKAYIRKYHNFEKITKLICESLAR